MKKVNPIHRILLIILSFWLFSACKRISFEEYALPEYDGALNWEQVTDHADWPKRYDHAAIVFQNKIWIIGGYNPGVVSGDTYFEDVWSSEDGKNWTLVLEDAPFHGRKGHALAVKEMEGQETLLLIGGFSVEEETGYRQYNNDVWKTTDGINWEQIRERTYPELSDTADWMPRMHHSVVKMSPEGIEYLYLLGGQTMLEDHSAYYATEYFNDVWRSLDGISWEKLPNNDYGIRSEQAVAVGDERLYLQGGMHGLIFDSPDNSSHPLPDWQYLWTTEDGINWTSSIEEDIIPGGYYWRSAHEMVWYREKVWILPGKTTSSVHYHLANSNHYPTWTFQPESNWEVDSEGTAIDARHSYATVVFDDKIWVLGGFTNHHGQSNDVWTAKM